MKHEETPVIPIMAMGSDEEDSTGMRVGTRG